MKKLAVLARRARQRLVAESLRALYRDRHAGSMPTAMLVGAGRSGTTWVAEIIDSQVPCRILFEPFHPGKVDEYRRFRYFQYMHPAASDEELERFCGRLFAGRLRGAWIDGHLTNLRPQLRLVKAIRPTLMLRWIHNRFPQVPILYTIRHPCAVVLSRMRLQWATDTDIAEYVTQADLVRDHLESHLDTIRAARTDEEKHAVIWCIANLVPLRQFADGGWTLLFYEDLRSRPDRELPRLFGALDAAYRHDVFAALRRPSRTLRHIPTAGGADGPDRPEWRTALSPAQIDRVLAVVDAFGLGGLYGESDGPQPAASAAAAASPVDAG